MMVVSCDSPIKTTADLVKAAKENPGNMNYASWGYGSTGNIMGEMFKLATGTNLMHIPYKGESPAAIGLIGGETQMRSEEHTSELQSLMRISYAVFCLKKKNQK